MTPAEFAKRLDDLREALTRALAYYAVWKALLQHDKGKTSWSIEDRNSVLGHFRGFFTPVTFALRDIALMEFAKIFDRDPRTASLWNLLNVANGDPSIVPHIPREDLVRTSTELDQSASLLANLNRMRNRRLAHLDSSPGQFDPLLTKDLDALAESVASAFNTLSVGHDKNFFSLDHCLESSDQQTEAVLTVLLKDMERKAKEHEDEMVRIGLEEVRRTEKDIGLRLNEDAIHTITRSLGLTEEQVTRVAGAYASGA